MCGDGRHMGNLCIFFHSAMKLKLFKKKSKVLMQDTPEQK